MPPFQGRPQADIDKYFTIAGKSREGQDEIQNAYMLAIIRRLWMSNIHEELVSSVQVTLGERNSHWQI